MVWPIIGNWNLTFTEVVKSMKGSALAGRESRWLAKNRVGVERVYFPQNNEKLGDRKCLGKSRKSFVGHPNAILFWRISQLGVFQQPLAISLIDDMDKVS